MAYRIDVPTGIVLRKQLYSGRNKPIDDDDDNDKVYNESLTMKLMADL